MTRPKDSNREKRGYHHGNLRKALIDAALSLIGEKGPAGFTFAEAARAAGVSPAAPYRHFRDREALIADVAAQGFEIFAARLQEAWNEGRPSVREAFNNVGRAYLAFARDEPAFYTAMFESGVSSRSNEGLAHAGNAAFEVLKRACEAVCESLPPEKRPPTTMMALHVWSMSHGIASLFARGDDARRPIPMPPEDLLEAGILIYLDGLKK